MVNKAEKEFEARYYTAESDRLRKESKALLARSEEFLVLGVNAWKEVRAGE